MIALMLEGAEEDLEAAFNYYEVRRSGLGGELVDEFRRAVSQILEFPGAWQALDETYRRCRLHRFPYGGGVSGGPAGRESDHRRCGAPEPGTRMVVDARSPIIVMFTPARGSIERKPAGGGSLT